MHTCIHTYMHTTTLQARASKITSFRRTKQKQKQVYIHIDMYINTLIYTYTHR